MRRNLNLIIVSLVVLALLAGGYWYFTQPATSTGTPLQENGFGVGDTRTVSIPESGSAADNVVVSSADSAQQIFKISDGPITTATLVQTTLPTTTFARYVLQENGHVADLLLDSAGQVPRAVSNTTIPGTAHGLWVEGGNGVVLQYLDSGITKTVYVGFPATGTSTQARATRIQFLPDNIQDIAASPDGKSVAYLLKTSSGSDGYTARADGVGSKKLFSMPLSQTLISWPAPGTLLLQTKSSAGSEGAAFSVNAQSGAISPLVYAAGLSAIGNATLSQIVYQTSAQGGASYAHNVQKGTDIALAFGPMPEKCVWSKKNDVMLYCGVPFQYVPPSYLDLWHQGLASVPDALFSFNTATGSSTIIASIGSGAGVTSDIAELAVSPDEKYLIFIKKGDRSLWGVRLTN
jgi:hypothetical protein